jgi:lipopolysaccharide export system protein LptA
MIKKLSIFIAIISYGANMQITSKHFEYNQTANISIFTGDVNVTKGTDNILSNKITLFLNKNKKLQKLVANGDVKFRVSDKNATYVGKSNKLTFIAKDKKFIFEGDVHIKKVQDKQELFGNIVVINKKAGTANVLGEKNKPLKFIIKVDE